MPPIRRSDPRHPGIRRVRAGKGFGYRWPEGRRVDEPAVLDRIRALAIPPAWQDVWICIDERGHLQALGTDAAGRRQYRYHDGWRQRRDAEKFRKVEQFGRRLPALRRQVAADLALDGMPRERVLACAARLLDLGFFRVGGESYADANGTFGLATLRREHTRVRPGSVVEFEYLAKGSKERLQSVVDPAVADVVAALKRRRGGGPDLLAWRRPDGGWCDVRSADINAYLKEHLGAEVSAKDFRTWTATVLAAVALAVSSNATSERARKLAERRAFNEVSEYLGNTPAVCRSSYVDPRVVDAYRSGVTIAGALAGLGEGSHGLAVQGPVEKAVLRLLSTQG